MNAFKRLPHGIIELLRKSLHRWIDFLSTDDDVLGRVISWDDG